METLRCWCGRCRDATGPLFFECVGDVLGSPQMYYGPMSMSPPDAIQANAVSRDLEEIRPF